MRCERCGPKGGGGQGATTAQAACTGMAQLKARGPGHARTLNISRMSVTPEVFQLEMSASKFCKLLKSSLMSETPETSQPATGPYIAMADAGLALTAWTAVFREAVLVKVEV